MGFDGCKVYTDIRLVLFSGSFKLAESYRPYLRSSAGTCGGNGEGAGDTEWDMKADLS